MSHRRPPSDFHLRPDLRPDPGHHASSDHDSYRAPQESLSSSRPSSSRGAPWPQDAALSILSSCGLEPGDLALLAELPEDVLTVESLPHVLQQIKGKRGTIKPFPPNTLSSSSSSSFPRSSARPSVSPSTTDWDHCSQSVQYPPGHVTPRPLPFDQDLNRWGRADPQSSSSSSSSYVVDRRPGPSDYGKTGRDAGPESSWDRPSFSSAERSNRSRSSGFCKIGPADHRSAPLPPPPPPEEHRQHRESETFSIRRSSSAASIRSSSTASMPSKKEAKDFYGTSPPAFPYSCSLCDITVMSEKVWIKHINGTQHADGQLSLLQQFPNWDCRMETVSRSDSQSEKWKDEGTPVQQPQTANQNSKSSYNTKPQKKTSNKGKVVCVKFPAQSVDETYLRKLTEPFGKIVKILMFPSLAFVELGSIDQAKDLVKFHVNYPPTVNGQQMEFRISNTFTFLQSSRVVSFSPAPTGENGQSDLFTIIKRFGPPLYTLFLPSMAFVEMKNAPDAEKMVDYYSSNTLKINDNVIKVSFSGEYKSLMRVTSAKRYEEEPTKRTRSSSRDKDKTTETKRRRSSKDREEEEGHKSSRDRRTRTRSREKSTKEETTRTRSRSRHKSSRDRRTRTRSREKSTKEETTRTRSRSRDKSSRDRRTRTRSREKSSTDRRTRTKSKSREKSVVPERTEPTALHPTSAPPTANLQDCIVSADSQSRTDPGPAPVREPEPEAEDKEQTEEEAESSADDSDIEGMEVIGEDGESLGDEDVEEEDEEDEDKMEAPEKDNRPAERTDSPEEDEEKEVKGGEAEQQEEKEKPINEKELQQEEVCGMKTQEEVQQEVVCGMKTQEEEVQQEEVCGMKTQEEELQQEEVCGMKTQEEVQQEVVCGMKTQEEEVQQEEVCGMKTQEEELQQEEVCGMKTQEEELQQEEVCGMKTQEEVQQEVVCGMKTQEEELQQEEVCGMKTQEEVQQEEVCGMKTQEEVQQEVVCGMKTQEEEVQQEEVCGMKTQEEEVQQEEVCGMKTQEEELQQEEVCGMKTQEEVQQEVVCGMKTQEEVQQEVVCGMKTQEEEVQQEEVCGMKTQEEEVQQEEVCGMKTQEEEAEETTETTETQLEDEEEPDFPLDLENCITLDELEEDQSGDQDEVRDDRECPSGRVVYFRNLPLSSYTDVEFLNLVKGFGTPVNFIVIRRRQKGFIEMSTSSEALRAVKETTCVTFKGSSVIVQLSNKYKRLTNGSAVQLATDLDEKKRSKRRRSKRLNWDEQNPTSEGRKDSVSRNSPEEESNVKNSHEKTPRPPPETDGEENQENTTLQRKENRGDDSVPENKESSNETQRNPELQAAEAPEGSRSSEPGPEDSEKNPDQPDSTGDPPKPHPEQDSEVQVEQLSGLAGGAAELLKPPKPVGTEFVRPVVGYFCNLCQLIYADEDEAKAQHCSSRTHYRKYQEKTGKDPWAS